MTKPPSPVGSRASVTKVCGKYGSAGLKLKVRCTTLLEEPGITTTLLSCFSFMPTSCPRLGLGRRSMPHGEDPDHSMKILPPQLEACKLLPVTTCNGAIPRARACSPALTHKEIVTNLECLIKSPKWRGGWLSMPPQLKGRQRCPVWRLRIASPWI